MKYRKADYQPFSIHALLFPLIHSIVFFNKSKRIATFAGKKIQTKAFFYN